MLTCGEKELLEIFKHASISACHYMTYDEILMNSRKHMSVSNVINLPVILHSLEHKNIISTMNMKIVMLTAFGKKYLDSSLN